MKKTVRQYPLQRSPIYRLGRRRDLEELLYMQKGDSRRVKCFSEYNIFDKEKSSGGSRTIEAPCSKMKKWQRRVWDLMARIEKPDWVISATKGKSYKDNASKHRSNGYVMTMDISSFYPSCVREYVYRLFRERLECSPDVAQCLTDICTYRDTHRESGKSGSGVLCLCKNVRGNRGPRSYIRVHVYSLC